MKEEKLDELIAAGIRQGSIAFELDDRVVDAFLERSQDEISEAARHRIRAKVKLRRQDAAIALAKASIPRKEKLSLGRYCEALRENAGLTRADIATRLRTKEDYVQRLERGDLDPLTIPAVQFADLVEVFQTHLNLIAEMLVSGIETAAAKQSYRVAARAHGGIRHEQRTEDVERALDAFARKMRVKSQGVPAAPETHAYVAKVREVLERRGRGDLLK